MQLGAVGLSTGLCSTVGWLVCCWRLITFSRFGMVIVGLVGNEL